MATLEFDDEFQDGDVDSPRRKLPVNKWIIGGAALAVLLIVGFAVYWFVFRDAGNSDMVYAKSRSLELHLSRPQIVERVVYTAASGQVFEIRPRASNRNLAVVNTTVVNRTSLVTPILVDSDAAKLGNRRGERINALNPFESARPAESYTQEELDKYAPLLWGQVELDKDYQVQGWMVFDVPKGLVLGTFWWDEVDLVVGDYIDYSR